VRLPLLPDIISDLLLLSSSRSEAERLCALEFLSSACCTDVPRNRQLLLDNNLFRQVGTAGPASSRDIATVAGCGVRASVCVLCGMGAGWLWWRVHCSCGLLSARGPLVGLGLGVMG
jgi:hypothetical protein